MEENQWTIPPANLQRRHGIPCAAERLGPAFQQNMRALEQAEAEQDATVQNCFCPLCSDVQRTQALPATEYPPVELDPSNGPLHLNQYQNARDLAETAVIVPDHARVPQIARIQDNVPGPSNVGLAQTLTRDASIAESRRRLAGGYLNNPSAYVSTIRLEPGPSGRLEVIISLII